ncbi:MAG: ice-binding family protein [Anaerolineae bacterium]
MRKFQNVLLVTIVISAILVAIVMSGSLAQGSAPSLGTAQSFAVLAGTTVTNTGPTTITGDLGVSPGSAVTGFPPGTVNGAQHVADAVALQAQSDLTTAYNALAGQACTTDLTGQDLGGLTLVPGVYCFSSSAQLTGALTLNAEGNSSAVFIFQIGSTLTTASNASVAFINGANPCNVYWQVGSSATIGTGTNFAGNILALTSIALQTGANLNGRALARNGAVTLDNNVINNSQCSSAASPTATTAATAVPTSAATAVPTSAATAVPTSAATAAPTSAATAAPTSEATAAPTNAATATQTSEATAAPVSGVPATGGAAPLKESRSLRLFPSVMLVSSQLLISEPGTARITDLHATSENLPLVLRIPSLQVDTPIIGVGITAKNVMVAPRGSTNDPVWWKAFWYRGSGNPGESGTTTIAGHVVDNLGRPAVFANLADLQVGSLIIVHNTLSGLDINYRVVRTATYTVQESSDPAVLAQIYGVGPVLGKGPQPASDGLSHLTLITCGGDYLNGAFTSRVVVFAKQVRALPK